MARVAMTMPASQLEAPASVRAEIARLCKRFIENRPHLVTAGYNEETARAEFINPFFEALGWDVANKSGSISSYREVVHEEALRMADGATAAPDYTFRFGGKRAFFVEAKRPSANLAIDKAAAYQLRSYAWTAALPVSVLFDFSELAIYDTRVRPYDSDHASVARIQYWQAHEYIEHIDEIWSLLSREAVAKGLLDALSLSKRHTTEVDVEFLKQLDEWREELAKDLAKENPKLTVSSLNYAVQTILDRIVFLRIAEDRGIEAAEQLARLAKSEHLYKQFLTLTQKADGRYNSGLFDLRSDTLTPSLTVSDSVLKKIITSLYYPKSPYQFSVLPLHILGSIYERFLGKVIVLDSKHRATIEERPEVKKAGGIFYTRKHVIDYIVKHAVGPHVEGKSPKQLAELRVVDPACGSGSFLIGAYEYLLEHYLGWYLTNGGKRKHRDKIYEAQGGFRLTTKEKRRIVLQHIYGVDRDRQAVEVTKLSLLLKMMEGESQDTVTSLTLFGERLLPSLENNIKCGNSLIARYGGRDAEERRSLNPFDWPTEFPGAFSSKRQSSERGFTVVVGNPPYVNIENVPSNERARILEVYGENGKLGKRYDVYQVFIMRSIELLQDRGTLGFIVPNTFLTGTSYAILRKRLVKDTAITQIVDLPQGIFPGVTVDNVLLFFRRDWSGTSGARNKIRVNRLRVKSEQVRLNREKWDETYSLPQKECAAPDYKINILASPEQASLFRMIEAKSLKLGDITDSSQGIILYETAEDAEAAKYTSMTAKKGWKKLLRGKGISRYAVTWQGEFVDYCDDLWCPREEKFFIEPKILLHAIKNKSLERRLTGAYDDEGHFNAHNLANIIAKKDSPYSLKYVLGIFNSSLANAWYKAHFQNVNINPNEFRQIPIRRIDFDKTSERQLHDELVALVEEMISLKKRLSSAQTPPDRVELKREIDQLENAIDDFVYRLYALTSTQRLLVSRVG